MWIEAPLSRELLNSFARGDRCRLSVESADNQSAYETETWTGVYQNSESTGEGKRFDYWLNEEDEYRVTLVIDSNQRDWRKVHVSATDGSHESLVWMEDVDSFERWVEP